jgi:hypothetical protein
VFELTDYTHHAPMKKKGYDVNNLADKNRKTDHMYSDIMGSRNLVSGNRNGTVKSPNKKVQSDLHLASNTWSNADVRG